MKDMITPQMKDKVLSYMLEQQSSRFMVYTDDLANELNIKPEFICLIIEQFEKQSLCQIQEKRGLGFPPNAFVILLTADAYDAKHNGGFVFQEEIMKANLAKLDMELEKLHRESSERTINRIEKIMSIVGTISSAFPFIDR